MHTPVQNVYIYVKKDLIDECCKYGMKLSSFCNLTYKNKKGILAYLSPKDSDNYTNPDYEILRIKINNIKSYIFNKENTKEICKLDKYTLGDYINPNVFINSSIMPENIFKYNRILDVPLLIENSKDFYLSRIEEKKVEIESSKYTYNDLLKLQ